MTLREHYDHLYTQSADAIRAGNYGIDNQIDSPADDRSGITLLARPGTLVKASINSFLDELRGIEPAQYYYPPSDMHITVMSIISCYSGFDLAKISVDEYVEVIGKSLESIRPFRINFCGITASASAVMVQGFPEGDNLSRLRDNLRHNFRYTTLEQSIDKRYTISTAHTTVMRFREGLSAPAALLKKLEEYRHHTFGEFIVDTLDLVYNDWYQREKSVRHLHTFRL